MQLKEWRKVTKQKSNQRILSITYEIVNHENVAYDIYSVRDVESIFSQFSCVLQDQRTDKEEN